ncbi:MAG: Crp/Fnr family transcriptional regulator [Deltaproteobacteria bacterium]
MSAPIPANRECGTCPIRLTAVCSRCTPDELSELSDMKYYRTFTAGQPVAWAEDRLDFVASVVTGVASLSQTLEDGRRQMVGLLLPSDFMGRPDRDVVPYDVTAVTDLTFCCFRRQPFARVVEATPHVASRLLEKTMDELDAAREWMMILGRKTARERIASLLVILMRRNHALQGDDTAVFDLPLTREQIADYLGLTLETVSRQFSALKGDGMIELVGRHGIRIVHAARLQVETGEGCLT